MIEMGIMNDENIEVRFCSEINGTTAFKYLSMSSQYSSIGLVDCISDAFLMATGSLIRKSDLYH